MSGFVIYVQGLWAFIELYKQGNYGIPTQFKFQDDCL